MLGPQAARGRGEYRRTGTRRPPTPGAGDPQTRSVPSPNRVRHGRAKRTDAPTQRISFVSDPATQIKAILSRTFHELEELIENEDVARLLRRAGSIFGLAADPTTSSTPARRSATPAPAASSTDAPAKRNSAAEATQPSAPPRRRAATSTTTPAVKPRPSRPRAGGRREDILALVLKRPGLTLTQVAEELGLKDATGRYPVARRLQDDGLVRKTGAHLHPTAKAQK